MKLYDDANMLLISLSVVSFLTMFMVISWPAKKLYKPVTVMVLVYMTCIGFFAIHNQWPNDIKNEFNWASVGVFILVAAFIASISAYALKRSESIALIVATLLLSPFLFLHNGSAFSAGMSALFSASVPGEVGNAIFGIMILILGWIAVKFGVRSTLRPFAFILIATTMVFITIRIARIEGPAPGFNNIELNCFDQEFIDKCPLGLEGIYLVLFLYIFTVIFIFRLGAKKMFTCWNQSEKLTPKEEQKKIEKKTKELEKKLEKQKKKGEKKKEEMKKRIKRELKKQMKLADFKEPTEYDVEPKFDLDATEPMQPSYKYEDDESQDPNYATQQSIPNPGSESDSDSNESDQDNQDTNLDVNLDSDTETDAVYSEPESYEDADSVLRNEYNGPYN